MRYTTGSFILTVTDYYQKHGRSMPWRTDTSPYSIFVSELMLQQTQVGRVLEKYKEFLSHFPNFQSLHDATLTHVLRVWQGMGYNRRAKYLQESAQIICRNFGGLLPKEPHVLETLPGVGPATAGSISCFAFDTPTIFIETNIRRSILHHFFPHKTQVPDTELKKILIRCMKVLKKKQILSPRQWYWALMDYGSSLKTHVDNPNRRSKHYTKQSAFEGSDRQIRGRLLKGYLNNETPSSYSPREKRIWIALVKEGLVSSTIKI